MEEGRPLTAREFFAALEAGYQPPRAPWAEEDASDNDDAKESTD